MSSENMTKEEAEAMERMGEKVGKGAKKTLDAIEDAVVTGYHKIEDGVVGGYKKIEDGVVGGFTKMVDGFVDRFMTKEGESVEEAKARIAREQADREAKARATVEASVEASRNAGKRD